MVIIILSFAILFVSLMFTPLPLPLFLKCQEKIVVMNIKGVVPLFVSNISVLFHVIRRKTISLLSPPVNGP